MLVETPPLVCALAVVWASMSAKLVSVVLNPAVWVLAMFPEMLLSAKACAEAPATEFESASYKPIGVSRPQTGLKTDPRQAYRRAARLIGGVSANVAARPLPGSDRTRISGLRRR